MKTHITLLLDRSGSMGKIAGDTIGGINRFIEDQKKAKGEATFTLVLFNDRPTIIDYAIDVQRAKPLTNETFIPAGNTALLDALSSTIDETGTYLRDLPIKTRPDKVVFVIVTDGEENSSKSATRQQVFDKISHQKNNYSWQFVFLGANQDAIQEATKIGIPMWYSINYTASKKGVESVFDTTSANIASMRGGGASAALASYTNEDRDKALEH